MDHLIYLYAAVVLIAAALASIVLRGSRALSLKVSALVLAALLMATGYVSLVDLLGRPKPAALEWSAQNFNDATVLAAKMLEDEAIYLWVQFDGMREPRAFVLPWSLNVAKELQQAMRAADAQGTLVRMRKALDAQGDPNEPLFYAEPQQAPSPKVPFAG